MPHSSSPVEGKRRTKANRRLAHARYVYQEYPKHKYHASLGKDSKTGNWNSRIVHSREEEDKLGDGWYDNPGGAAINRSAPPPKKLIQDAKRMAGAGRVPPAVLVGDGQAKILIGRTWEERRQFLTSARETLTQEQPLKLRIDAILDPEKWSRIVNGANDALDAEVKEITAAAWRITESQREAAGKRLVLITEAYRCAAKRRMEDHLAQGPIAWGELGALESLFEEAYKSNPELSACVFIKGPPATYRPGDLEFRQLATRAAGSWESWLDIVVGYLLEQDHKNEYMEKQSAATASGFPKGAEPKIGENYIVRRLLKASALCCSWLKGHKELQNGAAPAGHHRRKRPAPRRGYRPEIRQWMDRRNLRTNAQAARELRVSVSLLKSIMSAKGKKRYGDETLKRVLEEIGLK